MLKNNFFVIFLCFTISITISGIYFFRIEMPLYESIKIIHDSVANFDGVNNAPWKYRILDQILSASFQLILNIIFNNKISFQLSYIILNIISIFLFLLLCYYYFREFFNNSTSIIGILLIGILLNIHLKDLFIANTILDSVFFVLALLLIKKEKNYFLIPLLLIAGINRETSIIILVIFFINVIFLKKINFKNYLLGFYLALTYLFVFFGLRLILGEAEHMAKYDGNHFLYNTFYANLQLEHLIKALFYNFMFFGFLWIYIFKEFKFLNNNLKKNYLILLFYLPLIWVFGAWHETRLLIPMYPIVIPSLLNYYENKI